jgi:hypothetical protein
MEQLTAFEQRLSSELHDMAGSGRRIDAMAMTRSVSNRSEAVRSVSNPSHWWRFQPMFNATKLALAGALLALFGGFLISHVQAPAPNVAPGQVGGSPSPVSSGSPSPESSGSVSAALVTKEVESGVVRILKDGAGHDLEAGHPSSPFDTDGISIGGDGTVWINSTYHGGDNQAHPAQGPLVWALGRPGIFRVTDGVPAGAFQDVIATADGSALLFGDSGVVEFDGSKFVPSTATSYPLAEGTLRVFAPGQQPGAGASPPVGAPTDNLFMINANGHWSSVDDWTKLVDLNGSFCMATYNGVLCEGDRFGDGKTYLSGTLINQIALAPDGSLWAVIGSDGGGGIYRITLP